MHLVRIGRALDFNLRGLDRVQKIVSKDIGANGGHYKREKCGAIDVHPLEKCKTIEVKGLTPRNAEYRTWLYQNSPSTQKEIKRPQTHGKGQIQCHECKEWGHNARNCPNRQNKQKWDAFDGSGWARDSKKNWYKVKSDDQRQQGGNSSHSWSRND